MRRGILFISPLIALLSAGLAWVTGLPAWAVALILVGAGPAAALVLAIVAHGRTGGRE